MVRNKQQRVLSRVGLAVVVLAALAISGCRTVETGRPGEFAAARRVEPTVRVRVVAGASAASFDSGGGLWLGAPGRVGWKQRRQRFVSPITITRQRDRFTIVSVNGSAVTWALRDLMIVGVSDPFVRINGAAYPHTLVLHAVGKGGKNRFDVVNHVRLETYLPGVLHRELFSSWHPTAFRAQAIAARTYALYQARQRRHLRYDLESTTADQAYGGQVFNRKAIAAVLGTEGIALTYQGRIIPAYYSSCCGGTSQDAAKAIKDAPDIPPLRGTAKGGWCQKSKYFRWGPIQRPKATLTRRIAAWGKANGRNVAQLGSIRSINVSGTNAAGRPTGFVITDARGRLWPMGPEEFRFACNFADNSLATPAKDSLLRSSHVDVTVEGQAVRFTDGRGFGHGAGLCQWGAQAMAVQGYSEYQILSHYYPGADVTSEY